MFTFVVHAWKSWKSAKGVGEWSSTSWLDLMDYQQRTHSFDAFGVFMPREFSLTAPGQPQHLTGVE
jgi:hypothetical protein